MTGGGTKRGAELKDGDSFAGAEVEQLHAGLVVEVLQGFHMGVRAVHDLNVVADSGDVVQAASGLYLPLQDEGAVIGVLAIWWTTPHNTLPPAARRAMNMLTDAAGNTVARLYALTALRTSTDTDPLTGLLNRRAFAAGLKRLPADSARRSSPRMMGDRAGEASDGAQRSRKCVAGVGVRRRVAG